MLHNARELGSPRGSFIGDNHAELTPLQQWIQEVFFQAKGE